MNKLRNIIYRARGFRNDENGQVILLSGVMIFFIVMFVVVTVDSSVAIKHKIIAQNAADTAADAAAMWQARGLNLIQHLNNFHRIVNYVATGIESVGCIACVASAPLFIAKFLPIVGPGFEAAWQVACVGCVACAGVDRLQLIIADAINAIQLAASYSFPVIAFISANTNAENSEADRVIGAVADYLASVVDGVGGDFINLDTGGAFFDLLGNIPFIYAFPINADQLLLSVEEKEGTKYPWKTPNGVNVAWQAAGNVGQVACITHSLGNRIRTDVNHLNGKDMSDGTGWGYVSSFYWGNPGFITWVAGKALGPDAGGASAFYGVNLQDAIWLDSDPTDIQLTQAENTELWYTGDTFDNSNGHEVPPVIGLASAHIEGSVVTGDNVDPDAEGFLIPVQQPFGSDNTGNEMHYLLIYH